MYKQIVNPETGRKCSVNSRKGKHILQNYIHFLSGGSYEELCIPGGLRPRTKDEDTGILQILHTKLPVLGQGAYGKVMDIGNGKVIKAMFRYTTCEEALVEFNIANKIFTEFQEFKSTVRSSLIDESIRTKLEKTLDIISVPEMHKWCPQSIKLDGSDEYSCFMIMDKKQPISIEDYLEVVPDEVNTRVERTYIDELMRNNDGIPYHLLYSNLGYGNGVGIVAKNDGKASRKNAFRGYMSYGGEEPVLNFLRNNDSSTSNNVRLGLTDDDISYTIGVIYAIMFYVCELYPRDVEILLSFNKHANKYEIAPLDFGMCVELNENLNKYTKTPYFREASKIFKMSKEDHENEIKNMITSEGLYIDFDDNEQANLGWNDVKELVLN